MRKLTLLFLSVVCTLCLAFSLTACGNNEQGASQGLKYELSEDGKSYIVTGIGSFDGINLVIPSEYDGKPVTAIGQAAFYDCKKLTNVTIPDSITTIGDKAFDGCIIKKLTAPAGLLTDISKYTLETAIITSGEEIPEDAFKDCKELTSVTLPNSITSIGDQAFEGCNKLTNVNLPDSLTSIGRFAFEDCTSLTSITLPDSLTSIGSSAFYGCRNLANLNLPNGVTSIGGYAFCDCASLNYTEFDNALYFGNENNPYLLLIKAKDTSITSCNINSNTKYIHAYAFKGCERLTQITIPSSVTCIDGSAFSICLNLTSVTFEDTSNWYEKDELLDVTNPSNNAENIRYNIYSWEKKQ